MINQEQLRNIFNEVLIERLAQDAKWGEQNHPVKPANAAYERTTNWSELSTISKRECDLAAKMGCVTWWHILKEEFDEVFAEDDLESVRAEAIQLTALGFQLIEYIDRRKKDSHS